MAKTRTVQLIAKLKNQMTPGLRNIARGSAAAATAMVAMAGAAFAAAKKLSDYGAEIFDVSAATGIAVEDVQALGYAFEQTGGSMTSMSGAIRGLNTFMRTAATGSAEYMNVLADLGLEYDTLRAMEPERAFLAITDAIGGIDSAMERNIAATTVFGGRYAQQVTGALEQAGGSLTTLTEQFEESGNAMSGEQIASLKAYSDAMTDLEFAMKKLTADALEPLLPELQDMADKGMELAKEVLPQLIPLIEAAIDTMVDTLPTVIHYLGIAADGWKTLSDAVKNGIGTTAAEDIMNTLTQAVKDGTMTVEQATEEWENFTSVGRSTASTVEGMLNPFAALRNSVQDADAAYGIFGDQQIIVNEQLNNAAMLSFRTAEGFTAIDTSARTSTVGVGQLGAALGMVAFAYSNLPDTEDETDDPIGMGNAVKNAEDFKIAFKEILVAEIEAHAQSMQMNAEHESRVMARITAEKDAEFERIQEVGMVEEEANAAREAALDKANAKMETFTGSLIGAALSGKDAWSSFWNNMQDQIAKTVLTEGFMALLNFATGGLGGGFLGNITSFLGFKGGGTVPHYSAAGGMTVPGSTTSFGDKTPIMAEAGEVVLSNSQRQDLQGGSTINHISLSFPSTISTASSAQIAQAVPTLKKILQKGNLI